MKKNRNSWIKSITHTENKKIINSDKLISFFNNESVQLEIYYDCIFENDSNDNFWTMKLTSKGRNYKKILKNKDTTIKIESLHTFEDSAIAFTNSKPLGFEFKYDSEIVASVEVLHNNNIWIVNSLNDKIKTAIAIASSALLIVS